MTSEAGELQTIVAPMIEDGAPEAHVLTAYEYRIAVVTLRKAFPNGHPAGVWRPLSHLIGMLAELSMKAYLLQSGTGERELKSDYGHEFDKLLAACISKGLIIDENHKQTIERLSMTVVAHFFRYGRRPGDNRLPWPVPTVDVDRAMAAADVLIDAAARKVGHAPLLPDVDI